MADNAKSLDDLIGGGLVIEGDELFIDFDSIEELELVDQGMYPATIVDGKLDKVQSGNNAGKPKLTITLAITSDPYVGRKLYRNYTLVPQSMWAVGGLGRCCGLSGKIGIREMVEKIVGCDVAITVTHRPYMGEMRSNVQNVFPASALEGTADDIADMFG
jgi:hypothetical protein